MCITHGGFYYPSERHAYPGGKHPRLAEEFNNGKFVVHKSSRDYSAMAIDQAHKQANAVIKGDGGAVGVTENPLALRR